MTAASASRPRIVLVQSSASSGPGRLTDWLVDEGVEVVVVAGPDLGERLPAGANSADGLVVLGGGFMPDDDGRAPFLPRLRALVGEALSAGMPVLGICLGAQVLALVAGGEVTARSGETERGSCAIELLPAARDDRLFAALTGYDDLRMIENHQDSITTLPPAAVHLATSAGCHVQAFRVGAAAWGVQFHPEAAAGRLASWDEAALAAAGFDRTTLLAQAEADEPVSTVQARALVGAFAEFVRRSRR